MIVSQPAGWDGGTFRVETDPGVGLGKGERMVGEGWGSGC
jgi:hypothetical protein